MTPNLTHRRPLGLLGGLLIESIAHTRGTYLFLAAPFDSLPRELESMVSDLGLSPLEAIHAATGEAARAIGVADKLGGRAADMLVVDGDPSVRISDLMSARMVIKGGRTVVQNELPLE